MGDGSCWGVNRFGNGWVFYIVKFGVCYFLV